ncbi:MAG TPA: 30S ribosomal protein S20 [Chloroflexota bacterium]|nr:30S ribosomal protein S20 [Chloroflexota bacterium]
MANTKSAIKHIKTSEKRRLRNRATKSAARTYVKQARTAMQQDASHSASAITAAIRALDKAAQKGVIHRNNAARRKSRLIKLFKAKTASS